MVDIALEVTDVVASSILLEAYLLRIKPGKWNGMNLVILTTVSKEYMRLQANKCTCMAPRQHPGSWGRWGGEKSELENCNMDILRSIPAIYLHNG